ncbi:methylase related with ubiquinone/menaquinone biosynthesis [Anaerolinea thermolimosa]|uniref:class I SAM-dependent methyltransferase n=1 Tax=Anaerolinea thermolimosa TaxID=229919 RepID=UPI000780B18C|nr:class I SAM-dependent methyltransferase [Anaerolinea thermolimosa]GAP05919.1 methylase related with ubiquinone/menaquinone biosynthesis [Anaerolinea thermolimosa]
MISLPDWHRRYTQQAGWTQSLRNYLYNLCNLAEARSVLEVGCGTGVILQDLLAYAKPTRLVGVDIEVTKARFASRFSPQAHLVTADANALPFDTGIFDVTLCHFFLMWVDAPAALMEMKRVTAPGGILLALAEPDYGGRIDYPDALAELGQWQARALQEQGADPLMGRKLRALFSEAGLQAIQSGVIGGQWQDSPAREELDLEWCVLRSDLQHRVNGQHLNFLEELDRQAWKKGTRVLFVPTFYAMGIVP